MLVEVGSAEEAEGLCAAAIAAEARCAQSTRPASTCPFCSGAAAYPQRCHHRCRHRCLERSFLSKRLSTLLDSDPPVPTDLCCPSNRRQARLGCGRADGRRSDSTITIVTLVPVGSVGGEGFEIVEWLGTEERRL